jgi:hypothetical protein
MSNQLWKGHREIEKEGKFLPALKVAASVFSSKWGVGCSTS